jgi:hypothetical protein
MIKDENNDHNDGNHINDNSYDDNDHNDDEDGHNDDDDGHKYNIPLESELMAAFCRIFSTSSNLMSLRLFPSFQ